MNQARLDQAVARATGEDPATISRLGFAMLTHRLAEPEREPLVIDWDEHYCPGPDRYTRRPCR